MRMPTTEISFPHRAARDHVAGRVRDGDARNPIRQRIAIDVEHHRLDRGPLGVSESITPAQIVRAVKETDRLPRERDGRSVRRVKDAGVAIGERDSRKIDTGRVGAPRALLTRRE